jgi:hypothetical protein
MYSLVMKKSSSSSSMIMILVLVSGAGIVIPNVEVVSDSGCTGLMVVELLVLFHFVIKSFPVDVQQFRGLAFIEIGLL